MALVREMEDVQVHFPSDLSAGSFGRQAAHNARALQHAGGPVALHPALISRGVRRSLTWRAAQPNLARGARPKPEPIDRLTLDRLTLWGAAYTVVATG